MPTATYAPTDCADCNGYLGKRGSTISRAIIDVARDRDISSTTLYVAYMRAVHDRHMSGLSLDVQP